MLHAQFPHRLVDDAEPPSQQCGRCRLMFAGDPTLLLPARPTELVAMPALSSQSAGSPPPPHRRRPPRRAGDTT
jgi:hypothetical protein